MARPLKEELFLWLPLHNTKLRDIFVIMFYSEVKWLDPEKKNKKTLNILDAIANRKNTSFYTSTIFFFFSLYQEFAQGGGVRNLNFDFFSLSRPFHKMLKIQSGGGGGAPHYPLPP